MEQLALVHVDGPRGGVARDLDRGHLHRDVEVPRPAIERHERVARAAAIQPDRAVELLILDDGAQPLAWHVPVATKHDPAGPESSSGIDRELQPFLVW